MRMTKGLYPTGFPAARASGVLARHGAASGAAGAGRVSDRLCILPGSSSGGIALLAAVSMHVGALGKRRWGLCGGKKGPPSVVASPCGCGRLEPPSPSPPVSQEIKQRLVNYYERSDAL